MTSTTNTSDREAWITPFEGYAIPESWTLDQEQRDELSHETWALVLLGEDDPETYTEMLDYLIEEAGVSDEEAAAFFEQVIERRRAQQTLLGDPPASALSTAFDALASIGVVGRENFTCCGTCGAAEIGDERDESREWRGYVYYHQQDAERIGEDRSTYIGYGAFLDAYLSEESWNALSDAQKETRYEQITVSLMNDEVIPLLEQHGIEVEWNRDLDKRILLSNVDYFAAV